MMSSSSTPGTVLSSRPERLVRQIRFLVAFTIAYNLIEGAVALVAGSVAGSSALLGFGLDSLVEVSSALGVAWQFAARDHEKREAREQIALRITACSFFALAGFTAYHSVASLLSGQAAAHSRVGITIAALSLLVMPLVSGLQRRAGKRLGSTSAVADSKQTLLCAYMSGVLLVGLLANSLLGWWWADPVAALAIAALAVREGINAWRGDACCTPAGALFEHHDHPAGDDVDAPPAASGHCCDHRPTRILGRPADADPSTAAPAPHRAAAAAHTYDQPRPSLRLVRHCACGPDCSGC